ncbi:MAG: ArnT family glycosyltransferase, partial [Flavobacteriales bacterium]
MITAFLLDLNGDEAYYWMFSQNLDWGYFDHPPAVALLGSAFAKFSGNHLLFRLPALILSAASHLILGQVVLERNWSLNNYLVAWWCLPLLHLFGFVLTPDAPLLFLSANFIWLMHHYFNGSMKWRWILVPFLLAAFIYSKYQGVFMLGLALIPFKGFYNWRFISAALIGVVLVIPHLIWLDHNNWMTFQYHLSDRSTGFHWSNIALFLLGQLAIFNPIIWKLLWKQNVLRSTDPLVKMGVRVVLGLFLIFLFFTLKGRVEPHWTSASALFMVMMIASISGKISWKQPAVLVSLIVIAALHLFMFINPMKLNHFDSKNRMSKWATIAKGKPILFMNSYGEASLYRFYTGGEAHSWNNMNGRKNQYDYWQYDAGWSKETTLVAANYPAHLFQSQAFQNDSLYYQFYDSVGIWNKFHVRPVAEENIHPGQEFQISVHTGSASLQPVNCPEREYPLIYAAWLENGEWKLSQVYLDYFPICPEPMRGDLNKLSGKLPL